MKNIIARIVVGMMVSMCLFACGSKSSDTSPAVDSISITSISPASAVTGTNTPFAVDVSYSLVSKDSGLLSVGFNANEVNSFLIIASQTHTVAKGSGTHTFNTSASPVNWGSAGSFQAHVILSENPHPPTWSPLASASKSIAITPSAANTLMTTTDAPSQCHNDVCR
jgi:hypothetical protein